MHKQFKCSLRCKHKTFSDRNIITRLCCDKVPLNVVILNRR